MRLSVPFLKFQVPIRLFVRAKHFGLKRATGSPACVSPLFGDLGLRWATIGARDALKFGDEVKAFSQFIPLGGVIRHLVKRNRQPYKGEGVGGQPIGVYRQWPLICHYNQNNRNLLYTPNLGRSL